MTKEEKELLFKDLCTRLPYGVKVCVYNLYRDDFEDETLKIDNFFSLIKTFGVHNIKPYLRPMSSMTVEEEYEYHQCKNIDYLEICEMEHTEMLKTTALCFSHATDWLNKNGFDYRGLIPMGLALEAKEGMYF